MSRSGPDLNLHGRAWLRLGIGPQRPPPAFQRLSKPLAECRLALITSGGFVPPGSRPVRTGKLGDPTFREIPGAVEPGDLQIYHTHYDHGPVRRDINVLFPIPLCRQLAAEGAIGELAPTHYSFMGYVPLTRELERRHAPEVARRLKQQEVDAVLLTPA